MDLEALGIAEEQTLNSFAYEDGDLLMQLNASLSESLYTWNSEKPLPLALEAGEEPILLGQLTVLVVNPYSENREIALEFLEEVIGLLDEINAHSDLSRIQRAGGGGVLRLQSGIL